jgi:U3 small nucleolar RNA-associated protein 19
VDADPFLENEVDPSSSRAVDSCLWEIKSLQSHLVPTVAIAARFIDEKLPGAEWDLADVLEIKFSEVGLYSLRLISYYSQRAIAIFFTDL